MPSSAEDVWRHLEALMDELQGGPYVPPWEGQRMFPELTSVRPGDYSAYTGAVVVTTIEDASPVRLDDRLASPKRFRAERFQSADQPDVTITVDYSDDGEPVIDLQLKRASRTLLRRLSLSPLLDQVTGSVVYTSEPRRRYGWEPGRAPKVERLLDEQGLLPPGTRLGASDDEVFAAVRRPRRAGITPEDVARAADAYRTGGIDAVQTTLLVAERQAWRYVQRAQAAGLIERARKPREGA